MSVAKVIEISSSSSESFEDAIGQGLSRAQESVRGIQGAWVKEQKVTMNGGSIGEFRVDLAVTFVMDE